MSDPEYFREQVSAVTVQERATADVVAFASEAEHWAELEPQMPRLIEIVKDQLGPSASPKDVLARAYSLAIDIYLPDVKAKEEAAVKAAVTPDPARTATALKAKSVNIAGGTTGKAKPMSEDEALLAVYHRANKR